jgi:hypothetical protein
VHQLILSLGGHDADRVSLGPTTEVYRYGPTNCGPGEVPNLSQSRAVQRTAALTQAASFLIGDGWDLAEEGGAEHDETV